MTQWVKILGHNHEDLSLDLKNLHMPDAVLPVCISSSTESWEMGTGEPWALLDQIAWHPDTKRS